jgi:hypothetical protein
MGYTKRFNTSCNNFTPRVITVIVAVGFASSDYCIYLHSAAPRAMNAVIT